jgi:2-oxoglutarate dehydrogenase E1 component
MVKGTDGMNKTEQRSAFEESSFLYGGNAQFVEQLYAQYLINPAAVDAHWRQFFDQMADATTSGSAAIAGPSWKRSDWPLSPVDERTAALDGNWTALEKLLAPKIEAKSKSQGQAQVPASAPAALLPRTSQASIDEVRRATMDSVRALMLIRAYRMRGHLAADLDPLKLKAPGTHPELDPASYGFTEADYDRSIYLDKVLGLETATMKQILEIVKRTYCGTLGVEFMHITDPKQKAWLQERIEGENKEISFTKEGKKAILNKLIESEGFENFLNVKYTGTKRFGLDGGEAMIPALEQIIKRGGNLGMKEIVLGMAHRGRLNVLGNVMAKPYSAIFHEFQGGSSTPDEVEGSGDVKYHLGSSSDRVFDGNTVHLSLTANPSHLEIVDPVVLGKARAKQDQRGDKTRTSVLPLLIHGDAAFAGQGVVAECLGLSGLKGHRSGGSLHFIVNNQIGFTTSPIWSRSSPYPSDIAKMIDAPIFHANGDDPEAVVFAAKVATEFRQEFKKPVVIDMFCYRRFGHNETDEPAFTQPLMYKRIATHRTVVNVYAQRLIAEGVITEVEFDAMKAEYRKRLDDAFSVATGYKANKADWLDGRWAGLKTAASQDDERRGTTGVKADRLKDIGQKLTKIPKSFSAHKTMQRVLDQRRKMIEEGAGLDWAMAEHLAFGTLLDEGSKIRLSGQDVQRGTFSQRHAVLIDQQTEKRYTPLNHLKKDQPAKIEVINSMLSEEAVLGFEYGYSLAEPNTLTVWEAQFGDFANGAQVIFDQFLSSGERKWLRMSGLVCLLPHGYEGQGPEHSSARLERFLQMCAEDNMQVANCSTPANYFHILRRQMKRDFRKPLIIMTPKSLLRHKRCTSTLAEMGEDTTFHRLLWDDAQYLPNEKIKLAQDDKIRRVILCSGKVYYDLYDEREKRGIDDVYILRVEQLYPWPHKALAHELSRFKEAEFVWCQEEPQNMGAWTFVQAALERVLEFIKMKHTKPGYAGRPASASTATGLMSRHLKELKAFLDEALA